MTVHAALGAWRPEKRIGWYSFSVLRDTAFKRYGEQQHAAFLSHLRDKTLDAYRFGAWDMNRCNCTLPMQTLAPKLRFNRCVGGHFFRWGINAIAFNGAMVNGHALPDESDEWWVTAGWPLQRGRLHTEVAGDAVVVHFAYRHQRGVGYDEGGALLRNYLWHSAQLARDLNLTARTLPSWELPANQQWTCKGCASARTLVPGPVLVH